MNIFQTIKQEKGFLAMLSPMEDVTDTVFRQMLCKIGKPDVFFTEFMNVEGYCSVGKDRVDHRIRFNEIERPIVIQLWGNVPEDFAKTVREIKELKPDGFDINMGCAVRNVINTGGGSALIKEPELVKEIIQVVKQEAGDIPVSVKTRLGYSTVDTENWIGLLLNQGLDMLTVHGRIAKDSYAIPSRWDEIQKVVKMRDEISPTTLIIGNGDITSSRQGEEYVKTYGTDGYMVGRGILNNPWLFSGREDIPEEERFNILLEHAKLFNEVWGDEKIEFLP
jgi:tRNA-dihydrouridine synthase